MHIVIVLYLIKTLQYNQIREGMIMDTQLMYVVVIEIDQLECCFGFPTEELRDNFTKELDAEQIDYMFTTEQVEIQPEIMQ